MWITVWAVDSAGDVDDDGFDDIIVGAQKYLVGGERSGSAFVYLGGAGGVKRYPHKLSTPPEGVTGSLFGGAVAGAGDVNGDGYDDVIVGAPNHHELLGHEGAVYVYHGGLGHYPQHRPGARSVPEMTLNSAGLSAVPVM